MTKYTELVAAEAQYEHVLRLDTPTDDLVPRPFLRRPRPKTALIAQACAAKALARVLGVESLKPSKKPKRQKYVRVGGYARQLTLIEVCEFKAAVRACIARKCADGQHCWEPDCERCSPP